MLISTIERATERLSKDESESSEEEYSGSQCKYPSLTSAVGSVAYGLPTLAVTRRTTASMLQTKHVEAMNAKLCKIMRVPDEFLELDLLK